MSDALVRIEGLAKSYRSGEARLRVLEALELGVAPGEMVAITGVSGSGKSTLLHLVGGMDRPDRGSIRIDGTELTALDRPSLARFRNRTIGFVFQFHHLLPEFSAAENVQMPLLIRGTDRSEAAERADKALDSVGLASRAHHRPGELSGGEQQRVAIARALVGEPLLLRADEPTGNLDPHTGDAVGRLLVDLHRARGLTSIVVTHNPGIAAVCTRSLRLHDGRLT